MSFAIRAFDHEPSKQISCNPSAQSTPLLPFFHTSLGWLLSSASAGLHLLHTFHPSFSSEGILLPFASLIKFTQKVLFICHFIPSSSHYFCNSSTFHFFFIFFHGFTIYKIIKSLKLYSYQSLHDINTSQVLVSIRCWIIGLSILTSSGFLGTS